MTATTVMANEERGFDVFKVIERDGERSQWRKVGRGAPQLNGGMSIRLEGLRGERALVAVVIDRDQRPIPPSKDARHFPSHELFEGNVNERQRVGVVFVNRDASFTLLIDEGERDGPKARLQMRVRRPGRQ
jgi:hypothetical protein